MSKDPTARATREAQRQAREVPLLDWAKPEHRKLYVTRGELVQFMGIFDRAVERRLKERYDELAGESERQRLARLHPIVRWLAERLSAPLPPPAPEPDPEVGAAGIASQRVTGAAGAPVTEDLPYA